MRAQKRRADGERRGCQLLAVHAPIEDCVRRSKKRKLTVAAGSKNGARICEDDSSTRSTCGHHCALDASPPLGFVALAASYLTCLIPRTSRVADELWWRL